MSIAYKEALETKYWLDLLKDSGFLESKGYDELPLPLSSRKYSGKFMVRVPPEVHRHLAIEAAEAGVSLNRIASAKLAH